eukprot:5531811-Amphidinium_carterae.1
MSLGGLGESSPVVVSLQSLLVATYSGRQVGGSPQHERGPNTYFATTDTASAISNGIGILIEVICDLFHTRCRPHAMPRAP